MKRCFRLLPAALALVAAAPLHAQQGVLSIGYSGAAAAGTGGGSTSAYLPTLTYQAGLSDLLALSVSVGYLHYTNTSTESDHAHREVGKGPMALADLKFFPGRKMFEGFYFGPGVGLASMSLDDTDTYSYGVQTSSTSGMGSEIHGKAGWMFRSDSLFVDPHVQVGYFLSMPSGTNNSSTINGYLLIGVDVGMRF